MLEENQLRHQGHVIHELIKENYTPHEKKNKWYLLNGTAEMKT